MSKQEIFDILIDPICALEEYVQIKGDSCIVGTISIALRHILNEIERDLMEERKK